MIRHEVGHDQLYRSSDNNTFGGHSLDYKNMVHYEMFKGQDYSEEQLEILRRLHNVGPIELEPLFRHGNFVLPDFAFIYDK